LIKYEGEKAFLGIVTDITERKKAEERLRESEDKLKAIFSSSPDAITVFDLDGNVVELNQAAMAMHNFSEKKDIIGKSSFDFVARRDLDIARETFKRTLEQGSVKNCEFNLLTKDGQEFLVELSASVVPDAFGKPSYIAAVMKDITQSKKAAEKAQQQLEESKRHFQTLFNLMVDPVAIVDKTGKILEVTDKVEEITGFNKEELVGKNFLRTKIASTKTKAIMMKNLAKRMMGMHMEPYEVEILTKDGRKLPYEINAETIDYKGKPADMVVFRDISQRKNLEAKLRVVGTLTRHDARNKLSAVTMNTFLAKKKLASNHEALQHLNEIELAVGEVERIFEFAKTYEMLGMEKLVNMDVGRTLEETVHLFSDLQSVKVVNDCRGLTVQADSLLGQLFYNLIHNSLKHGKKVSQIRVFCEKKGKDQLELIYEDDGVGIAKAEKEKIFEERYGNRTGHGLYVIRRMCEVYGWSIKETGEHGKGAKFSITMPTIANSCHDIP